MRPLFKQGDQRVDRRPPCFNMEIKSSASLGSKETRS